MQFKLVINDPKTGKSYQKEITSPLAERLVGLKISESFDGNLIGFEGYQFLITGGSDKSGFPMRKGIKERRKRVLTGKGVGFRGKKRGNKKQKGIKKRVTVAGETIHSDLAQINLKIIKHGEKAIEPDKKEEKK